MQWKQRRPTETDAATRYQTRRAVLERHHEADMLEAIQAAMRGDYELPSELMENDEELSATAALHRQRGTLKQGRESITIPEPRRKPRPGQPEKARPVAA